MREFVIPLVIGVAVALAWFAIWAVGLRAFHLSPLVRTPEERIARRERVVRMGKLRYILIFGILGYGLMFGLALAIPGVVVVHHSRGWVGAAAKLVLYTALFGCWQGFNGWNTSFRGEVPFPPHFPPQN